MMEREEYVEQVLSLVERIPAGRVMSYGGIAEALQAGGPRQVGAVMASMGGLVPWWRVAHADGSPPRSHRAEAHRRHVEEGTPLRPSGAVDMRRGLWVPELSVPTDPIVP